MDQNPRPSLKIPLGLAAIIGVAVVSFWPEENPFAGVTPVPLLVDAGMPHLTGEPAVPPRKTPTRRRSPGEDFAIRPKQHEAWESEQIASLPELPSDSGLTGKVPGFESGQHPPTERAAEDSGLIGKSDGQPAPPSHGFVPTTNASNWTTNKFYSAGGDSNVSNQKLPDETQSEHQQAASGAVNGSVGPEHHQDAWMADKRSEPARSATELAPVHEFEAASEIGSDPVGGADGNAGNEIAGQSIVGQQTGLLQPELENAAVVRPATMTAPRINEGDGGPSKSTQGTTDFVLAGHPKVGNHYRDDQPLIDRDACPIPAITDDFSPDAIHSCPPSDPYSNQGIYNAKQLNANQRPLLELGRPWYQLGQLSPGSSPLGFHNNVNPQFLIFGDYRQAFASSTVNGNNSTQFAAELNTFWNLHLTSTERIVWGISPLDDGLRNTRWELDRDRFEFETDFDFDFGYLEGDLGALAGGFTGRTLPFDAPFAVGLTPVFLQNGIWLNDAVEGTFFTIPARNSPWLDISNMDISFGFIWDDIDSDAFAGDNSAAKAYAIYSFIEALNGYIELDYAFLEDRSTLDRSYHNISVAYSRRFGRFLSHSTRVVANAGQQVSAGDQTADGVMLLSENSLITAHPYSVIPYFNFFAGFDTPQSVAGDDELLNTGILFESDGMTGFPTLDIRGRETAGGAIGLNLLAPDFSQQLILETAAVFRNDGSDLAGDQYGVGMRYQLPLSNSWILRADSMYGFFRNDTDDFGMRMELRKKF